MERNLRETGEEQWIDPVTHCRYFEFNEYLLREWEHDLIVLYKKTGKEQGTLPGTSCRYFELNEHLLLCKGLAYRVIPLKKI